MEKLVKQVEKNSKLLVNNSPLAGKEKLLYLAKRVVLIFRHFLHFGVPVKNSSFGPRCTSCRETISTKQYFGCYGKNSFNKLCTG